MSLEYYWRRGDFTVVEAGGGGAFLPGAAGEGGVRLSFSEFRDLVQCQARGGLIVASENGRPVVAGRREFLSPPECGRGGK